MSASAGTPSRPPSRRTGSTERGSAGCSATVTIPDPLPGTAPTSGSRRPRPRGRFGGAVRADGEAEDADPESMLTLHGAPWCCPEQSRARAVEPHLLGEEVDGSSKQATLRHSRRLPTCAGSWSDERRPRGWPPATILHQRRRALDGLLPGDAAAIVAVCWPHAVRVETLSPAGRVRRLRQGGDRPCHAQPTDSPGVNAVAGRRLPTPRAAHRRRSTSPGTLLPRAVPAPDDLTPRRPARTVLVVALAGRNGHRIGGRSRGQTPITRQAQQAPGQSWGLKPGPWTIATSERT